MSIVIFDPAAFYGHHEYDIASTTLFGGYSRDFYDAYFKKIPKANGFENRMLLYHLFHYLNHWYKYILFKLLKIFYFMQYLLQFQESFWRRLY